MEEVLLLGRTFEFVCKWAASAGVEGGWEEETETQILYFSSDVWGRDMMVIDDGMIRRR